MDKFNIIDCGTYFTITNINGSYSNHCHVDTKDTAEMLVRLMRKKRVPRSHYLRQSAMRVTLDNKYKIEIELKIMKDRDKIRYYNVNRGVRQ